MIADNTFYSGTYGGLAIPSASYTLYGNRATAYLQSIIPELPDPATDDLKMAACAVADEIFKDDSEHGGIQSESVDGDSVTYKTNPRSLRKKCYDMAELYLSNSGLLGRWA